MKKVLFRARESFARDEAGNVAILFAAAVVPIIGLLGGAVDMARHSRYRAEVANAMDSAAIALVRRGAKDDAEADAFVNDYIAAMLPFAAAPDQRAARKASASDPMLHMQAFNATEIEGGWRVTSDGYMDTAFMPVVGIQALPLDLSTEVMMTGGKYEVALALDNTGSMSYHGRIEALRDAAGKLVDDLYKEEDTKDRVKMALIPFVTSVNIKTPGVFQDSWIDNVGPSQEIDGETVYGHNFTSADGKPVNREKLFQDMRVPWKGCVEARQAPYDEDDAEPTSAATRYVPYLWPDEPDGGYGNSYLSDSGSDDAWNRLRDVAKYKVGRGVRVADTTSRGPNAACPRPIVELTNDTARMHGEIDKMVPHNRVGGNSSGTNVAQGLVWAWNVLSPTEPYSQGVSYDDKDTTKVLVLLSDGRNQVVQRASETRVTKSDYTGYGYLAAGRMGSTTNYRTAEQNVDGKVSRICEAVKKQGIRVYTILFQVDFEETQDIFRNCASIDEETGKPLYYYVPAASQLETAFQDIGEDLTSLHISR